MLPSRGAFILKFSTEVETSSVIWLAGQLKWGEEEGERGGEEPVYRGDQ